MRTLWDWKMCSYLQPDRLLFDVKNTFLTNNNLMRKISITNWSIEVVMIVLLFLIAHYFGFSGLTEKYVVDLFSPVERFLIFASGSLSDWFGFYLVKDDLQTANDELNKKVIGLARKTIGYKILEEENKALKEKINFIDDYKYNYITARVLGRSLNYEINDILIDKGLEDGIEDGLAVVYSEGVIIGKTVDTSVNLSHIRLLYDNRSNLAAIVAGIGSNLGLAHGERNMNIKIDMLPKDAKIEIGDMVGTSGLERDIPEGLLIGEIVKITNEDEKLWQEAIVRPFVDYDEVRLVTVILPESAD